MSQFQSLHLYITATLLFAGLVLKNTKIHWFIAAFSLQEAATGVYYWEAQHIDSDRIAHYQRGFVSLCQMIDTATIFHRCKYE